MRMLFATSLILFGLLGSTSALAEDSVEVNSARRAAHVDAAVDAIVRELAAVGAGPRDAQISAPGAIGVEPVSVRRLGTLADEAAAARRLTEADEGEDDHAM